MSSRSDMLGGDTPGLQRLGAFIRERRLALKLRQVDLADRLGVSQERISLLENGKYGMPSLPQLARITESLESSLIEVLVASGYPDHVIGVGSDGDEEVAEVQARLTVLEDLLRIDGGTLSETLGNATNLIAQVMQADKIDVFLLDSSTNTLVALGTSATPMGERQREIGMHLLPVANGGRAVLTFRTGESYCTGHADEDREELRGIVEGLGVCSTMYVPLRVDGAVRGVLAAAAAQCERFDDSELSFFQSIAQWMGLMVHRAQLTEHSRRDAIERASHTTAEELITLVSHDLGNRLAPLKGRIDMMRRRAIQEGRERDVTDADEALRALQRIRQLISDLLDTRRLQIGTFAVSPVPASLSDLAERVAERNRQSGVDIQIYTPQPVVCPVDEQGMTQVLENLVSNAVTHSPPDTRVTIDVGEGIREDGTYAVVSVRDEGSGIPAEVMSTLFHAYSRGPGSQGLGFGLYAARRIVEAHGGIITVETQPGEGTTFAVWLPMAIDQ